LVLGPRATRAPSAEPEEAAEREAEEGDPDPGGAGAAAAGERADGADEAPPGEVPLGDLVLAAAESGIPAGLLDALDVGTTRRAGATGRSGATRIGPSGGRPAGTRAAPPTRGQRLNVVETLRAAAPWQRLRGGGFGAGVRVRPEDFRVTRHRQPIESCVIFAVDASGSAALRRLAEAKGAVERVLGDCYVRRDHVALVAFRQDGAELLLPPTRSLARVRRSLAALAGGGATPLAAGIDAAHRLALDARGRGREPIVVVMTDGRANVTRDGRRDPAVATTDALESARGLQRAAVPTLFLDTAPRPRRRARELAEAMDARYLPLPYLDAAGISRHVQALAREGAR
ncbi:MAG TPA: VWA domain-containing protein, partial [Polyangiaceae bacterium LLY-WYZ-15_(1-7)]|nr:VWA domain-containing protein [Polyangiaceae bacterium LLY-WYZ-15_(1-7)]